MVNRRRPNGELRESEKEQKRSILERWSRVRRGGFIVIIELTRGTAQRITWENEGK